MQLNFPDAPSQYQVYKASNNVTYQWDGNKWNTRMRSNNLLANSHCHVSPIPPSNPSIGTLWFNVDNGRLYVWFDDGSSRQWIDLSGFVKEDIDKGNSNHIGATSPSIATVGDFWFNTVDGRLYIYYNDGNSQQWTDISGVLSFK